MELQRLPFYNALSDDVKKLLHRRIHDEIYSIDTLITGDDRKLCDALFIVTEGLVRVFRLS